MTTVTRLFEVANCNHLCQIFTYELNSAFYVNIHSNLNYYIIQIDIDTER